MDKSEDSDLALAEYQVIWRFGAPESKVLLTPHNGQPYRFPVGAAVIPTLRTIRAVMCSGSTEYDHERALDAVSELQAKGLSAFGADVFKSDTTPDGRPRYWANLGYHVPSLDWQAPGETLVRCDVAWCADYRAFHPSEEGVEMARHGSKTFVRPGWSIELVADGHQTPRVSAHVDEYLEAFTTDEIASLVSDLQWVNAEARALALVG